MDFTTLFPQTNDGQINQQVMTACVLAAMHQFDCWQRISKQVDNLADYRVKFTIDNVYTQTDGLTIVEVIAALQELQKEYGYVCNADGIFEELRITPHFLLQHADLVLAA